jgi:hypothetical protein
MRLGHGLAATRHTFHVKGDGFPHLAFDLFTSRPCGYTAIEVGRVSGIAAASFLYDNQVLFHFFKPACFRILLKVPGPKPSLGLPGTVTNPVLWDV